MKIVVVSDRTYANLKQGCYAPLRLDALAKAPVYVLTLPERATVEGADVTHVVIAELKRILGDDANLIVLPHDVMLQAIDESCMRQFGWVRP